MAKPRVGTHRIAPSRILVCPRRPSGARGVEVRRTDPCPRHIAIDPHSAGPDPGVRSFVAATAAPSSARCRPAAVIGITARSVSTPGTSTATGRETERVHAAARWPL